MTERMPQIESFGHIWSSPEAHELFEHIQNQISNAMTVPDYVLRSPAAYRQWECEARKSVESLKNTAMKVLSECALPMVLVTSK